MPQPAVNDLNPHAQQFFSQVLTGVPSKSSDMNAKSEVYLPSPVNQVNPLPTFDSQMIIRDSSSAMADKLPNDQVQHSPEYIRDKLRKQLEYYFCKDNLVNDIYLQSQMDADNYVLIAMIANFKLVKRLTDDLQLIIDVLKEMPSVEVDLDAKKVRSSDPNTYLNNRKRCIIILRNVPLDATETEVSDIFANEYCPSSAAMEYERVLESNHADCWYVTFASEDDAHNAFLYLTRENVFIRGQKILARMKTRLWQKHSSSAPDTKSSAIRQDSPDDRRTTSIPTQQRYTLVYVHPTSSHSTLVPNIQQVPPYRPPPAFQSPYFPVNYNTYTPYDRPVWTNMAHQQHFQPSNLNSYPQAVHSLIPNHSVFPTSYWYIPSTIDSTSPMIVPRHSFFRTHNGVNRSKSRITREYPSISKSQNSMKPLANENPRQGEVAINNDHSNPVTPPSETSNSLVSDPNVSISHGVDFNSTSSSSSHQVTEDSEAKVSTAIYYNQTSALDATIPRSYADTLKFKQDTIELTDPIEQLTITDNSKNNSSRDRYQTKRYHRGNNRFYPQSTVHRSAQ